MERRIINPSSITPEQIGTMQELFGAALLDLGLQQESFKEIIGGCWGEEGEELVDDLIAVVSKHAEMLDDLIVLRARVDRSRNPDEVFGTAGLEPEVVATMPGAGSGIEEVEVYFFWVGRDIDDNDLEDEYSRHDLRPVDPYVLAAVNEQGSVFPKNHCNATHWQDANGRWCYAFYEKSQEPLVSRDPGFTYSRCWFAGIKISPGSD